jgi:hypothetical protein
MRSKRGLPPPGRRLPQRRPPFVHDIIDGAPAGLCARAAGKATANCKLADALAADFDAFPFENLGHLVEHALSVPAFARAAIDHQDLHGSLPLGIQPSLSDVSILRVRHGLFPNGKQTLKAGFET